MIGCLGHSVAASRPSECSQHASIVSAPMLFEYWPRVVNEIVLELLMIVLVLLLEIFDFELVPGMTDDVVSV